MIRVVVVDDHPVVRLGVSALLESCPELWVVGSTGDGLQAEELVLRLRPDVLVLDLALPGLGGMEILRTVRESSRATRVVIQSMHSDVAHVAAALAAGACGYVLKCAPPGELPAAVRAAARGDRFLGSPLSERAVEEWTRGLNHAHWDALDTLTPRERQALHLAAEGLSNPEIAVRMCISPRTAESHRMSVLRKLGLRNQAEIVRFAMSRGLLPDAESAAPPSPAT